MELRRIYEERRKYFENVEKYLDEIKRIVKDECPDAKIYLFGSVVEGNYSVGLSDIDVAVVSDEFRDRERKLDMFGRLTKIFFDSPFEFHVLTTEQWELFRKLVGGLREV